MLPLLGLTLLGDYVEYRTGRRVIEAQMLAESRGFADDVGRYLQAEVAALQTLALSESLEEGRFAAFRTRADAFLALRRGPAGLRVGDADGHAVFLAGTAPGDPSPTTAAAVFATARPHISGYHAAVLGGRPGFCIHVPVLHNGHVVWDLELAVNLAALADTVAAQPRTRPDGRGLLIADQAGTVLVHQPMAQPPPGAVMPATVLDAVRETPTAIVPGTRADGTELRLVLTAVPSADWAGTPWHVVLGIPVRMLLLPLWRATVFALVGGAAVLAGALVVAGVVARGILGPIERLQHAAAGSDAAAPAPHTGLPETDVVAARLHEAALARQEALARVQDLAATLESRVAREVAAREAAQAQAAAGERLQVLGRLASGIAHDFNNVLQTVGSATHMLRQRGADPETVQRVTRLLDNAGRHGAAITGRLLGFARRDTSPSATLLELAPVLADLREMLAATLGARVHLTTAVADGVPPVRVDRATLETVLINLAVNARDAMPMGGSLALGAEPAATLPPGLTVGRYVVLAVADTGIGMAPELLARVTEPFFTTKPAGKGTGLGLAMARSFADQAGGILTITSEPGKGTTVRLWLPAAAA